MLFVVVAEHDSSMCPSGSTNPNPNYLSSLEQEMAKSGVRILNGYVIAQEHKFIFAIEATDNLAIRNFCKPLQNIGTVKVAPAQTLE